MLKKKKKQISRILILSTSVILAFILMKYSQYNNKAQAQNVYLIEEHIASNVVDGPYVFINEDKLISYWVCNNKIIKEVLTPDYFPVTLNNCNRSATIISTEAKEEEKLEYSGDFKIAAVSDFHGQYDLMKTLLSNNGIIDQQGNWTFGDGHFVITGDIFDRGDKVTEILWFIYNLEQQAQMAGGQLHLLLGNHEVMVLNDDLRYLHPKYLDVAKLLKKPFAQLFSQESILGRWLRTKPVLVKINDNLFAHGGFHPSFAKNERSLAAINSVFKMNLVNSELLEEREGWARYLHKINGPIWYRGYFSEEGEAAASSEEIDLLLKHFQVKHLIVGHTSQKQIETRYQGRVIAIDSSIKNGEYGELLFIDDDKKWRGSLSGEALPMLSEK